MLRCREQQVAISYRIFAYLEMVQKHRVQTRIRGAIGIEEENRVGLHKCTDVEDVDLPRQAGCDG